jgi:transposase-like protein
VSGQSHTDYRRVEMAKPCSICIHEKVTEINEAVLSGKSLAQVAKEFGVSKDALKRHNANDHVPVALVKSSEVMETVQAENLFKRINQLEEEVVSIKKLAVEQGSIRLALECIDKQAKLIELYAKMKLLAQKGAEIGDRTDDGVPVWQTKALSHMICNVIDRHPLIEVDMLVALMALDRAPEGDKWVKLPETTSYNDLKRDGYVNPESKSDSMIYFFAKREEFIKRLTDGQLTVEEYFNKIRLVEQTRNFIKGVHDIIDELWEEHHDH